MDLGNRSFWLPSTVQEWTLVVATLVVVYGVLERAGGRPAGVLGTIAGAIGFVVDGAAPIAIGIAAAGALALATSRRATVRLTAGRALKEGSLIGTGFVLYELGRMVSEGDPETARRNGARLLAFEERLGLAFEDDLQRVVLRSETAVEGFNQVYSFAFIPVVLGGLFWLLLTDDRAYRLLRGSLGLSAALGVLTFALFPAAPPRLLPASGMVDSHTLTGKTHGFVNEFAAVPSFHVGWTLLVGFVGAWMLRSRRGALLAFLPGVLMAVTVMVTGNHFWVDGAVGALYSVGSALLLMRSGPLRAAARSRSQPVAVLAAKQAATMARRAGLPVRSLAALAALGVLLGYLLIRQMVDPGFTQYWGYMVLQITVTMVAIVVIGRMFAAQGGLSWPTLVIAVVTTWADTFGTAGHLYDRFEVYDKITHFLGAAAIAAAVGDVLRGLVARGTIDWSIGRQLLVIAVVVGSIEVGWETYEYLGDRVFNTGRHAGWLDTIYDLISDATGTMVACAILWRREAIAAAQERLATLDPSRT